MKILKNIFFAILLFNLNDLLGMQGNNTQVNLAQSNVPPQANQRLEQSKQRFVDAVDQAIEIKYKTEWERQKAINRAFVNEITKINTQLEASKKENSGQAISNKFYNNPWWIFFGFLFAVFMVNKFLDKDKIDYIEDEDL